MKHISLFHSSLRRGLLTALLALCLTLSLTGAAGAFSLSGESWMLTVDGTPVAVNGSAELLSSIYQNVLDSYRTENTASLTVDNEVSILRITAGLGMDAATEPDQITAAIADAITVETTELISQVEILPYDTVTVTDDTLYEDESVTQAGVTGLQISRYTAATVNGVQVSATEPEISTIREPQDEVVTVGTLERPEFIWPAHGHYTGSYGIDTINGANRRHKGVDIDSAGGTDIAAARAGTVVYAGWNSGGYGNLVVIQHDNGTHTYYAHNAELYVSEGDTVEQGEVIAQMGRTGQATGVHCHFEVRLGEYTGLYTAETTDPLNYLSLDDL